jgi:glycosyltransferase involved in cell wall biosynthesis
LAKLIFFVTEDWYFVSHRFSLAIEAMRQGYDVVLVSRVSNFGSELRRSGIKVIHFETHRRGMNPFRVLIEAFSLAAIYRREKPDLLHHVSLRAAIVGGLAARLCGIPNVVAAITGLGFLFALEGRRPWIRAILGKILPLALSTGLVIVQNSDDAKQLSLFGIKTDRQRLIAGAGVDTDNFTPRVRNNSERLTVMMASRLLWDKGVGEFVEAARHLQHTDIRFVLVGMIDLGNPAGVPESQVRAWAAEGVVEWWGHRQDMAETLGHADIFCLPSYREGLPKVMLEAMASGIACISTDVAGCRDVVRPEKTGILVPARDALALARAIERLALDSTQREAMAKEGRKVAVEEFRDKKIILATMDVYAEFST